jgi:hypothetical protein
MRIATETQRAYRAGKLYFDRQRFAFELRRDEFRSERRPKQAA